MTKNRKPLSALCALVLALLLLAGCTATGDDTSGSREAGTTLVYPSAKVSEEDLDASWDAASATGIALNGDSATISGSGAVAEGSVVTITAAGTYVLSGSLSDGQILIEAPDTALVRLVLNGVSIHCSTSAPINCVLADKLVVILADGTENVLSDGAAYTFPDEETDEPSAALFSKADLTINGEGSLTVTASYNNGIGTKDDLILVSGSIRVQAANHAIRGRDSVTVLDAALTLTAGADGIQANNDTAEDKGWIELYGGSYDITSGHDGIQAETDLAVYGGTFNITAGGGAENAPARTEEGPGFGGGAGGFGGGTPPDGFTMPDGFAPADGFTMPDDFTPPDGAQMPQDGTLPQMPQDGTMPGQTNDAGTNVPPAANATDGTGDASGTDDVQSGQAVDDTASDSYKGLKAGTTLTIAGGNFTINAADDGVHANGDVTISGGTLAIRTGDDGVHADATVLIQDGAAIDIQESYEGIEGAIVTIKGGDISITASDDGINAAGGRDAETTGGAFGADRFATAGDYDINIEGGNIAVWAGTDGLDSNGNITVSGGTLVIHMANGSGAVGGDGVLDRDGTLTITGGTMIGAGSNGVVAVGAAQSDGSTTQVVLEVYFSEVQSAGTLFTLQDAEGNVVCSFAPEYDYTCIVLTLPTMQDGATYTVYTGGTPEGEALAGYYTGPASGMQALCEVTLSGNLTSVMDTGEAATNTGGPGGAGGPGGRR